MSAADPAWMDSWRWEDDDSVAPDREQRLGNIDLQLNLLETIRSDLQGYASEITQETKRRQDLLTQLSTERSFTLVKSTPQTPAAAANHRSPAHSASRPATASQAHVQSTPPHYLVAQQLPPSASSTQAASLAASRRMSVSSHPEDDGRDSPLPFGADFEDPAVARRLYEEIARDLAVERAKTAQLQNSVGELKRQIEVLKAGRAESSMPPPRPTEDPADHALIPSAILIPELRGMSSAEQRRVFEKLRFLTENNFEIEETLRQVKAELALLKSNMEVARRYVNQRERILKDILSTKLDKKKRQFFFETLTATSIDFDTLLDPSTRF
eukprot:m.135516 g.135516  ORF g.135516 m.135516 type:complete len:327 (+) comp52455_c0_seq3:97-1077(+)